MAPCLPTWPLLLFGIIEPVLLVWAYVSFLLDPFQWYVSQAPQHALTMKDFTPQAEALSWQMANVLLLLAPIAIICCWTKNPGVTIWYLIVVAFADLGHIYAVYRGGSDYFWDVSSWNDMTWGNVGVSAFLHINRWLTVLRVFGKIKDRKQIRRKKA